MATTITYKEADKKKYLDWGFNGRGNRDASGRALKMVRPICTTCQGDPDHTKNWYETCPHGDEKGIYWSRQVKTINIPAFMTDEDGDTVIDPSKSVTKTKYVMVPNLTEVPIDTGHNSGEGYQKARAKGFKLVEEVGLAPFCQFWGCGATWPTVRTDGYGDYCSEIHAKLAVANEDGIMLLVPTPLSAEGRDLAKERRKQEQEILI